MNAKKHTEKLKRAMDYIQRGVTPTTIKTKQQFLKAMTKAEGIAKAIGTTTFVGLLAAIGYAIANAGYTTVVGLAAEAIQATAHATVDLRSSVNRFLLRVVLKIDSWINKAQKVFTKKDSKHFFHDESDKAALFDFIDTLAEARKANIDRFCESGVRYVMKPIIRKAFFIASTIAFAPIIINALTGGVLFAWAATSLAGLILNSWFGFAVFGGFALVVVWSGMEVRTVKDYLNAQDSEQLKLSVEKLEAELSESERIINSYEKMVANELKHSGMGYMRKQEKPTRK